MRARLIWFAASLVAIALPARAAGPDPKAIYDEHCAKCHGDTGMADTPVGKAMKAPALAELKWGDDAADQIKNAIRQKPQHKAVSPKLSDWDLALVAGYVKALAKGE